MNNSDDRSVCVDCGTMLPQNETVSVSFCESCGQKLLGGPKFCTSCGAPTRKPLIAAGPNLVEHIQATTVSTPVNGTQIVAQEIYVDEIREQEGRASFRCLNGHPLVSITQDNLLSLASKMPSSCPDCDNMPAYVRGEYKVKSTPSQRMNTLIMMLVLAAGSVAILYFAQKWGWKAVGVIVALASLGQLATYINGNAYEFKFLGKVEIQQDWNTKIDTAITNILFVILRNPMGNSIPPEELQKGDKLTILQSDGSRKTISFEENDFEVYRNTVFQGLKAFQSSWKTAW